jgi:hypothetical protein
MPYSSRLPIGDLYEVESGTNKAIQKNEYLTAYYNNAKNFVEVPFW